MIEQVTDFSSDTSKVELYKRMRGLEGNYNVIIKRAKSSRSNSQLKYYWAVIIKMLSNETGYHPDEMHEVLKRKFNARSIVFKTGEEIMIGGSTGDFDTAKMEEYNEQIRIFAATELDIRIPLPNEVIEWQD